MTQEFDPMNLIDLSDEEVAARDAELNAGICEKFRKDRELTRTECTWRELAYHSLEFTAPGSTLKIEDFKPTAYGLYVAK